MSDDTTDHTTDDTTDVAAALEPDTAQDTLFDDVGHRAGAALRRPAPADGPHRIAARRQSQQRVRTVAAGGVLIALAIGALFAVTRDDDASPSPPANVTPSSSPSTTSPAPTTTTEPSSYFSGALQHPGSEVVATSTWVDPLDAQEGFVDLRQVAGDTTGPQPFWTLGLAQRPQLAKELEPGLVIAYGLVLDTDSDGVANYEVGLATDGSVKGQFRVWVTDLVTGATREQDGPPYGWPIEFRHPDEAQPGDPRSDEARRVSLTFLPGTEPPGFDPDTVRFYAWASSTRNGEVTASDVAPDTGWIGPPGPLVVPTAVDPAADTIIGPGKYWLPASSWSVRDMTITPTVGWTVQYGHVFSRRTQPGVEVSIYAVTVDEIFDDPCRGDAGDRIAVGDGDLGSLLVEHAGEFVSGPAEATISGLPAVRYDLAIPPGYDMDRCSYPDIGVQIWHSTSTDKYFVLLRNATASVYIVEIDGQQQVVLTLNSAAASADDLRELDAVVQSIRFDR